MYRAHDLVLVGMSHRSAPVETRERYTIAPGDLGARLADLQARSEVNECWVVSTCNRTEVLVASNDGERIGSEVVSHLFDGAAADAVYSHRGAAAVFHVFRVAAGLDSQVLGESQILAQIKDSLDRARHAGTLGPLLNPLLTQALSVGKRVRTETRVGEGTLSVARAAVELAGRVLGSLESASVLVVGAGETGRLVARHLHQLGTRDLMFMNRTEARAREAAELFGGSTGSLQDLAEVLPSRDLTVVSVDVAEPLVRVEHLDDGRLARRDRLPVLIDLSMPRAVEPSLAARHDILVHGLDDLEVVVARHRAERGEHVKAAEGILLEEAHKFLSLRAYAALKPIIANLKGTFSKVREEVLSETSGAVDADELTDRLARRLLAETLVQIKRGARGAVSEESLDIQFRHYLEGS